jgi:hypothetical protein
LNNKRDEIKNRQTDDDEDDEEDEDEEEDEDPCNVS